MIRVLKYTLIAYTCDKSSEYTLIAYTCDKSSEYTLIAYTCDEKSSEYPLIAYTCDKSSEYTLVAYTCDKSSEVCSCCVKNQRCLLHHPDECLSGYFQVPCSISPVMRAFCCKFPKFLARI